MAPEVIESSRNNTKTSNTGSSSSGYSYAADIWSFGCTLVEMLSGKMIWSSLKPHKACLAIVKEDSRAEARRLQIWRELRFYGSGLGCCGEDSSRFVVLFSASGIVSDYFGLFEVLSAMLAHNNMGRICDLEWKAKICLKSGLFAKNRDFYEIWGVILRFMGFWVFFSFTFSLFPTLVHFEPALLYFHRLFHFWHFWYLFPVSIFLSIWPLLCCPGAKWPKVGKTGEKGPCPPLRSGEAPLFRRFAHFCTFDPSFAHFYMTLSIFAMYLFTILFWKDSETCWHSSQRPNTHNLASNFKFFKLNNK